MLELCKEEGCNEEYGTCAKCVFFEKVKPPSQLDRIEKRQTDDYNSLDARLTQLVLNTSAQLSDIEAKLDRILTNDLATNQDLLLAASGGTKGFDEVLKSWGITSD